MVATPCHATSRMTMPRPMRNPTLMAFFQSCRGAVDRLVAEGVASEGDIQAHARDAGGFYYRNSPGMATCPRAGVGTCPRAGFG